MFIQTVHLQQKWSSGAVIQSDGMALSRWRSDPITDPWGSYMYIRDITQDALWSPTFQPCCKPAEKERVQSRQDRSTFLRRINKIQTLLEITVSPESNAELRRLTITNNGDEARIIEVTTFLEIALAAPDADKATILPLPSYLWKRN